MNLEFEQRMRQIKRNLARTSTLLLLAGVTGCSPLVSRAPQVAFFDFGLMESAGVAAAPSPLQVDVVAPSWLSGSAMQYRLAWKQPERRRSYGESRWVAPPPDLLAQTLRRALSGTHGKAADAAGRSPCRLRVELDEFVQVFDTAERSRLQLVVRAQLLPAHGSVPLAVREFGRNESAPTPDAEGGVNAARAAVSGLALDLSGWLDSLRRSSGHDTNGMAPCALT